MVICHCNIVNDRRIRELVAAGAQSVPAIGARCGAGRDCGSCLNAIEDLVNEITSAG